jgi:hypothetical protein
MANELNRRSDTLNGAMLENNMYAWVASGAGRLDVDDTVDLTFSYADYVVSDKTRIKNPQAHIQFACDNRGIRNLYSKGGFVKRAAAIPVAVDTLLTDYNTVLGVAGESSASDVSKVSEKYFIKPRIDEFKLVSKIVRDMTANGSGHDNINDISYNMIKYDTVELWSGDKMSGGNFQQNNDDPLVSWRILDLCNNEVDGSYNVIAAGRIHAKYNISGGLDVWPKGLDISDSYTLHGFDVVPQSRPVKDISFSFKLGSGNDDDGLEGGQPSADSHKYILNTTYGNISGMKFNLGRAHSDMSLAFPDSTGWVCTFLSDTGGNTETDLVAAGNRFDLSYVRDTLSDTSVLDLNSDNYLGDVMLVATGATGEDCGLKCLHVPDSLHNLRNDTASSLAANFVGFTELMGDLSFSQLDLITPDNINTLATTSVADASGNGIDGGMNEVAAVYTISGDILSNKLKNFMLGNLDASGNSLLVGDLRIQHIHKVVYSASGETIDASNASVARYNNAVIDVSGSVADFADCSGEIRELTPQESAFFYYYPWASTYMCCSGSTVNAGAGDSLSNPFRQLQEEFLDTTYAADLAIDSIRSIVPTAQGWMDSTHGVYDVSNNRTEWYSFVDKYVYNNINDVQINDIAYTYQDLDAKKANYQICPLEIVFPDVSAGAVADASGNANRLDDDFCTLNFQIPLKSNNPAGQKRLDKVSNLNNGFIQLTNDYVDITDGFTAKCHATADKIGAISTNNTELMNAYMPVIVRLVGQRDADLA